MKTIVTKCGSVVMLDDDDFLRFGWLNWYVSDNGYVVTDTPIVNRPFYPVKQRLHRLISLPEEGMDVDHINGNKLDNRKENLRVCTRSENLANSSAKCNKKYSNLKGAYFDKPKNKWMSYGLHPTERLASGKRRQIFLGYYQTDIEAAAAYRKWAEENYGEFALHKSRRLCENTFSQK